MLTECLHKTECHMKILKQALSGIEVWDKIGHQLSKDLESGRVGSRLKDSISSFVRMVRFFSLLKVEKKSRRMPLC